VIRQAFPNILVSLSLSKLERTGLTFLFDSDIRYSALGIISLEF
jgi:hypothetical protein